MMECSGKGTPAPSLTLDQVATALRVIRTIEDISPELACLIPLLAAMPRGKTEAAKLLPDGRKKREKSTGPMKARRAWNMELLNCYNPSFTLGGGESEKSIAAAYKYLLGKYAKFLEGPLSKLPAQPPRGDGKHMNYDSIFWNMSHQKNPLFFSYNAFKSLVQKRYSQKWGIPISRK